MWEQVFLAARKQILVSSLFVLSMALLVSTAYAASVSSGYVQIEAETVEVMVDYETYTNDGSGSMRTSSSVGHAVGEQSTAVVGPVIPVAPIDPLMSRSSNPETSTESEPATVNVDTTVRVNTNDVQKIVIEEHEEIVVDGVESETETELKIRIRNTSGSDKNDEMVPPPNFILDIEESASAGN